MKNINHHVSILAKLKQCFFINNNSSSDDGEKSSNTHFSGLCFMPDEISIIKDREKNNYLSMLSRTN